MAVGNICVNGKCKGLYYVGNKFLDVYDENYEYDEEDSMFRRDDFEYFLAETLRTRFPSFEYVNKYISGSRKVLLENNLFYIICEDDQCCLAVELIQKEGEYSGEELIGLQMGLYLRYLKGIEQILLEMNGEVGVRTSAWTSGVIRKV